TSLAKERVLELVTPTGLRRLPEQRRGTLLGGAPRFLALGVLPSAAQNLAASRIARLLFGAFAVDLFLPLVVGPPLAVAGLHFFVDERVGLLLGLGPVLFLQPLLLDALGEAVFFAGIFDA